jgi:hypothetical protein
LPRYYVDADPDRYVLEITPPHASRWTVWKQFSADRQRLISAELLPQTGFDLDLRSVVSSVYCLSKHPGDLGVVFHVELAKRPGQKRADRMVLFVGAGLIGHLIPPFGDGVYTQRLVGQDGKYYEYGYIPGRPGLSIYRSRRVPGTELTHDD